MKVQILDTFGTLLDPNVLGSLNFGDLPSGIIRIMIVCFVQFFQLWTGPIVTQTGFGQNMVNFGRKM